MKQQSIIEDASSFEQLSYAVAHGAVGVANNVENVRVELSVDHLRSLMQSGALTASDVHCLDCDSKKRIWKICLELVASQMKA